MYFHCRVPLTTLFCSPGGSWYLSGGHFTHCQQPTTDRLKVLQGETGERESAVCTRMCMPQLCYCKCKVHRAACCKYELGRFPSHSQHPLSQLVCLVFLSCLQSSCMLPSSAAGTLLPLRAHGPSGLTEGANTLSYKEETSTPHS